MASSEGSALEFIEVHVGRQVVYVRVEEIQRLEEVPGDGTKIVFKDGSEIIVEETLAYFQKTLKTVIIIRTQTR